MLLLLVDRNLAAAFSVLLVITGAVILTGGSARGPAFPAAPHACSAEPPDPHDVLPASAAAANGTRASAGEHRLDDARVVAALRQVVWDHGVETLLHYPCGDMAWAGPVIAAVQNGSASSPAYLGADADGATVDADIMRFGREGWHFRWVDPARRWHAFPATFNLLFLRGAFGDGSPQAVAAVLRAAAAANATLVLVDSFSGRGDGVGEEVGVNLRQPPFNLPRQRQTFGGEGTVEQLLLYHTADLEGLDYDRMAAQ